MPYPNPDIEKAFPDPVLRGAQFAPFSALTGHDEAIAETARLTDGRILLSESEQDDLNRTLQYLMEQLEKRPEISVTYFVADEKKQGGVYLTHKGNIRKIRTAEQFLCFFDDTKIFIPDILSIELSDE